MKPLAELLGNEFEGKYRDDFASFMRSTESDALLAGWVETLVASVLGEPVLGALFVAKSCGAVFGLVLRSGAKVVLKLFWPRFSERELRAMERCLEHVRACGLPALRPLTTLFQTNRGLFATIYEYAEGSLVDPHEPSVRRAMAEGLFQLWEALNELDPNSLPASPTTADTLWPPPQRSFFDVRHSLSSAAWIDARARAAQALVRSARLPCAPAHLDWHATNLRFRAGAISAVLDWDSIASASEPDLVGRTAAIYTAQWELPVRRTPTHLEARAFVEDYESARGRRFSANDRRVLSASADYSIALIARQEHASDADVDAGFLTLLRACTAQPLID